MSKALIDRLLEEALGIADDAFGRGGIDSAMQEVTVTRKNLTSAFKEAFFKEHAIEFRGRESPFLENDKVFKKAASLALRDLKNHLGKRHTKSNLVRKTGNLIVFSQPNFISIPFDIMKRAGIRVINKELKTIKSAPLSDNQITGIKKGVERLHTTTTAGTARLAYTLHFFRQKGVLNKFFHSMQYTRLTQKYGNVTADYEIKDNSKGEVSIRFKQTVSLHINAKSKNFIGSASRDWTEIKPKLQKILHAWINSMPVSLAERKGSKSPLDTATLKVEHLILKALLKPKNVRGKGTKKPKSATRRIQKKTKRGQASNNTRLVTPLIKRDAGRRSISPLNLIVAINKQLPGTVAKNMGSPKLNYRTGRFASSIHVKNIIAPKRGFPVVDYTYMKDPYELFEVGNSRLATAQRDPRKIIDQSIREIAIKLAFSKFHTRRI